MASFLLFVALIGQVLLGQAPAAATGTVRGKVLDGTTKEGVRKATVTVRGLQGPAAGGRRTGPPTLYRALTADDGSYVVEGVPAVGPVRVSLRLGARPGRVVLEPGGREVRGEWKDGWWTGEVDRVEVHAVLVVS